MTEEQRAAMRKVVADAAAKLNDAKADFEAARDRLRQAREDHHRACVDFGKFNPPEGMREGQALKMTKDQTFDTGSMLRPNRKVRSVTTKGYLTLCGVDGGSMYRNHAPSPGEWFVLSASGLTAYSFGSNWVADDQQGEG